MSPFDWSQLSTVLITGLIGMFFGIISSYFSYRNERKRDELKWQHEKEMMKTQQQFAKEQSAIEWAHKFDEIEVKNYHEQISKLRRELINDIGNPSAMAKASITSDSAKMIPIVSSLPAGTPISELGKYPDEKSWLGLDRVTINERLYRILNLENDSWTRMFTRMFNGDNIVVRVYGDSMNHAGIENDDYVLLQKQTLAENNDIVAVVIHGEDNFASLRRYTYHNGSYILQPDTTHPDYKAHVFNSSEDFVIYGVVKAIFKPLE